MNDPQETILLECITTMVTSLLLALGDESGPDNWDYTVVEQSTEGEIRSLIAACQRCPAKIVLVTNEVRMGVVPESHLTRRFRDIARRVNQRLVAAADKV